MADIKLRIEVNPNAESEVLGAITNNIGEISNTSINTNAQGEFQNIPTAEFQGSNGLTWSYGYLVFNEDGYLDNVENSNAYLESEQSPDQFFWGVVPESKEYHVKLTFSNASNLKDIVIYGDKTNNQFPTEAIIDGETIVTSDDTKWAINLLTESDTHTIEFTKWNRANYNATITLIRIMLKYWEVDKFNGLKSVESLAQITGQPQDIFYGVVPSDGSAQIIDLNGEIYDMVNDGVIPNSNLKVEVFANGRKVQRHITEDTTYDNTQILDIAFTNSLSNWDNIKFNGMKLREQTSLYEVLKYILTNTNYISESEQMDVMLDNKVYYEGLYIPLKEYLQNIIIPYPYLEASSLREAVDKVCALAQLNVVENEVGEVKFVSAKPIIDIEKPIIKVTPKQVKSNPYRDVILKNKYSGINLSQNLVSDVIDYDTLIYEGENLSLSNFEEIAVGDGKGCVSSPIFQGWGARILQRNYYVSGSFIVPKESDYGLEKVLKIREKDRDGKFLSYDIVATKTTGECENNYFTVNTVNTSNATPSSYGTIIDYSPTSTEQVTVTLDTGEIEVNTDRAQAKINPQNESFITVSKNSDGDFVINYKVLAKQETWKLSVNGTTEQQS